MKATYDKGVQEKIGRARRAVVLGCFVFASTVIIAEAISLQHFQSSKLKQESKVGQVRDFVVHAGRGDVVDRNGEFLALSMPAYAIWADPKQFEFGEENIANLAMLTDLEVGHLRARLTRARDDKRRFMYIRRAVSPETKDKILGANIPGVRQEREYKRFYPLDKATAQLIGYTDVDGKGLEGIERAYEKTLRAHKGSHRTVCDGHGRQIEDIGEIKAPHFGTSVRLSIDKRIQYRAWRELKDAVEEHQAAGGAMVIVDANNGDVLALVNYPSFDPHDRSDMKPERVRNGAVLNVLEVGSVIKPFIAGILLEGQYARMNTMVQTKPGYFMYEGQEVRDMHDYGRLDMTDILVKSSNVGIARLSLRAPPEVMWQALHRLGFGQSPLTGFPGESKGHLRHYQEWGGFDRVALAYGYGFSASMLQLVRAYAAIANDGLMPPLSLLADAGGAAPKHTKVFNAGTARALKYMLAEAVKRGTGKRAAAHGYTTAGKTGTVYKNRAGGYDDNAYRSLFSGFAPANRPRLVAAVMIDEPQGDKHLGGDVAAPVFAKVMTAALRLLGVPEDAVETQLSMRGGSERRS